MKINALIAGAMSAGLAAAHPLEARQGSNIDVTVLQFALTLEHLENAFYVGVLNKFSAKDFAAAGYDATYYEDLRQIASDEQSHVALLQSALTAVGTTPVDPCQYSFPYTDVKSFITLSSIIEGVGTSAYLGGAPLITSKDYLTVAGSILVTEALHTSYQRAAIAEVPFANPYGTPLDPTSVFSLAAAFITSCPSNNVPLPFTPFPTLTFDTAASCGKTSYRKAKRSVVCRANHDSKGGNNPGEYNHDGKHDNGGKPNNATVPACERTAGDSVVLTTTAAIPAGAYVTFVSGLSVVSVQGTVSGSSTSAKIPAGVSGQTYVFITSAAAAGKLDVATVVAGPAIVEVTPPSPVVDLSI